MIGSRLEKLVRDRCGATMVEYGLIVALLAVVLFISLQASGGKAMSIISVVASAIGAT